jgi:Uncharacterised nucleotidyltransferase
MLPSTSGAALLRPEDQLLLAAIALTGPAGLDAWSEYRRRFDLHTVDMPADQILPSVYWNLRHQGDLGGDAGLLKGMFRFVWSKNQIAVDGLARILDVLAAVGIPTILLDDATLALRYYENHGLRPIGVARVLIRPSDAGATTERLRALRLRTDGRVVDRLRARHAIRVWVEDRPPVELCWSRPAGGSPPMPDGRWEDTVAIDVRGSPSRALDPTSELLRVLRAAPGAGPRQRVSSALDALTILRSAPAEIDWPRVVARLATGPRSRQPRVLIRCLRESVAAPVPPDVLAALEADPAPVAGRLGRPVAALRRLFSAGVGRSLG